MANRYWVGGDGNWDNSDTTHWSATSGGAAGASTPTASDNVFFNGSSGAGTVEIIDNVDVNNLDFTGYTGTINGNGTEMSIYGNLKIAAGMTVGNWWYMFFEHSGTNKTIDFGGQSNSRDIWFGFNTTGSDKWTFQSDYSGRDVELDIGELDTGGYDFTIRNLFVFAGAGFPNTLTLNDSVVTISSTFIIDDENTTVNAGTSSFILNTADFLVGAENTTFTFYDLEITNDSGRNLGAANIVGNVLQFHNLTMIGDTSYNSLFLAGEIIVTGTVDLQSDSQTNRLVVECAQAGSQAQLQAAAVTGLTNVTFKNIKVTGASVPWSGTDIGDAGGNEGIEFTVQKSRYWVGNAGNFDDTSHWSATSGGSGGASMPLPQDLIFFNANSITTGGQSISFNVPHVGQLDFTGVLHTPDITSFIQLYFYGNVTLTAGMTFTGGQDKHFAGSTNTVFISAGVSMGGLIHVNKEFDSKLTLQGDLTSTGGLTLSQGELDTNNYDVTVTEITTYQGFGDDDRTLTLGSSLVTLTGSSGYVWFGNGSQGTFTLNPGTSEILVNDSGSSSKSFKGDNLTFNKLTVETDNFTLEGNNTFTELAINTAGMTDGLKLTAGTSQTVTTLTTNGSSGNLAKVQSTSAGSVASFDVPGDVTLSYLDIKDNTIGSGGQYIALNSTDSGGNSGWEFVAITPRTQTGKARITVVQDRTQLGLSRVTNSTQQTQTGKSAIRLGVNRTQTGSSRITLVTARTQSGIAAISKTTQRTQTGKATVGLNVIRNQTGKASVFNAVSRTQSGVARISNAVPQAQDGLSRIQKVVLRTIAGKASLAIGVNRTIPGKSKINGITRRPQLGKARIMQPPQFPGKKYGYKIYTPQRTYLGTLPDSDVLTEFGYSQEINGAGSQFVMTLGKPIDSFGEGTLINFNNNVQVFVYDQDAPAGRKIFDGFISTYEPAAEGNGEQTDVTVLGYGETMDGYLIEAGDTLTVNQNAQNGIVPFGLTSGSPLGEWMEHKIVSPSGTPKLKRLKYKLQGNVSTTLPPDKADMIGQTVTLYLFATETALRNATLGSALGSASVVIDSTTLHEYNFVFASPIVLSPITNYYIGIKTQGQAEFSTSIGTTNTNPLNGGDLYRKEGTNWIAKDDPWFQMYTSGGNTEAPFLSQDPSDILRDILDDYNSRGGVVTYDEDSIEDTGTTVSYTFNTNTTFEGVKKCLELSPEGWYFYIDQATNLLHFHPKVNTPDYLFLLDKHISKLRVKKSIENVVNGVYFTGGDDGGGKLFKKYFRQGSIDNYGLRILRYTDQRVTVDATAGTMANSILNNRSAPEISTRLEILDNAIDSSKGYDIERIVLGKMLAIGGPGLSGEGNSFWDRMEWDIDYWDYNLQILSTLVLQITKLSYTGNRLTLDLSTIPPDVNKRIEDINRNLEASQTFNNPAVAEE